jgi:voltage-gated potassium channel
VVARGPQVQRIFTHFLNNFLRVIWYFRAILLALLFIIVIGAVPIALFEKIPFGKALYFSLVTGLTIGYGDIVMKTPLGRCIAIFIGFIGIIFTGLVIAAAIEAVRRTYHPK